MFNLIQILREKKRRVRRVLRTFHHIAQKDHGHCKDCCYAIEAGDEYLGTVIVQNGRFWVEKTHANCPVDDLFEEEWERDEQDEKRCQESKNKAA